MTLNRLVYTVAMDEAQELQSGAPGGHNLSYGHVLLGPSQDKTGWWIASLPSFFERNPSWMVSWKKCQCLWSQLGFFGLVAMSVVPFQPVRIPWRGFFFKCSKSLRLRWLRPTIFLELKLGLLISHQGNDNHTSLLNEASWVNCQQWLLINLVSLLDSSTRIRMTKKPPLSCGAMTRRWSKWVRPKKWW